MKNFESWNLGDLFQNKNVKDVLKDFEKSDFNAESFFQAILNAPLCQTVFQREITIELWRFLGNFYEKNVKVSALEYKHNEKNKTAILFEFLEILFNVYKGGNLKFKTTPENKEQKNVDVFLDVIKKKYANPYKELKTQKIFFEIELVPPVSLTYKSAPANKANLKKAYCGAAWHIFSEMPILRFVRRETPAFNFEKFKATYFESLPLLKCEAA